MHLIHQLLPLLLPPLASLTFLPDSDPPRNKLRKISSAEDDGHEVIVTAKFWAVEDLVGGVEVAKEQAAKYVEAMNGALARSKIPIKYRQWGSVQMLDKTHDYIRNKDGDEHENKMFLNSKGDSEEARQSLKQSADHMVIILNKKDSDGRTFGGPFRCVIYTPWYEVPYKEDYATVTITLEANGTFIHEAGHCLGAFHDRYTSLKQGVIESLDDQEHYDFGYCLPGEEYATIMSYAYNCPGEGVKKIEYFSNPDVKYAGVPTGDEYNNNARSMTEWRDETSQYGNNCWDGAPGADGAMEHVCEWTAWSGWTGWGSCCCLEDWRGCPTVPADNGFVTYTPHKRIRSNNRACINSLEETVHKNGCGGGEDELWETERCDCTKEEEEETEEEEENTCVKESGSGKEGKRFSLKGLKAGDKVQYTFRTLNSAGEKAYQNTGIAIKGSEKQGTAWNQWTGLYTRGSKTGEITLGDGDDGIYVHVFPYTEKGGWDFEACKAVTEEKEEVEEAAGGNSSCVKESGTVENGERKRFSLKGLKAGDKIQYTFRTLNSAGEKAYQNTGIAIKGNEKQGTAWNQFLYTHGSKTGEITLGDGDDGIYVHVFPYTETGGWDFEACKAPTASPATTAPTAGSTETATGGPTTAICPTTRRIVFVDGCRQLEGNEGGQYLSMLECGGKCVANTACSAWKWSESGWCWNYGGGCQLGAEIINPTKWSGLKECGIVE